MTNDIATVLAADDQRPSRRLSVLADRLGEYSILFSLIADLRAIASEVRKMEDAAEDNGEAEQRGRDDANASHIVAAMDWEQDAERREREAELRGFEDAVDHLKAQLAERGAVMSSETQILLTELARRRAETEQ